MFLLVLIGLLLLWGWLWYGLLPLRPQHSLLAGPDAALQHAYRAARRGRWEPAAQLFEDAGEDWERRSLYAQRLANFAVWRNDRWLTAWQEARPEDGDAALVVARARIAYAWKLRGKARAVKTSARQFEEFHRELIPAQDDILRARALRPGDPTPRVAEIWRGLGLGYRSHEEMRKLLAAITAVAPHHFEAHISALQFWTKKWHGSAKLVQEFADKAAADAPPGTLLAVLPLIAWYENYGWEAGPTGYGGPQVRAMVEAALADVAAADPDHPRLPEVRHLLAYFLYRQGRYRAAREQFRHVDGFAEALPWRYWPRKALAYRAVRTKTARKALRERGPR